MQESDIQEVDAQQDELGTLKARADMMGITYHPSIGLEKLKEKLSAVLTPVEEKPVSGKETESEKRGRKMREASELVRIRLNCMNPAKRDWPGEIINVGNSSVGHFKKFIPFTDADDGYHVPRIIYNFLVQRECQVFVTAKDGRGNSTRRGKMIKEFSIEVLPPLTEVELRELARRQAMAAGSEV